MRFVQNTHRQQEQTGFYLGILCYINFDIRLLKFNFTRLTVTCKAVLKLKFREETYFIREFFTEEKNETVVINLVVFSLVQIQVHFAVTTDINWVSRSFRLRINRVSQRSNLSFQFINLSLCCSIRRIGHVRQGNSGAKHSEFFIGISN